MIISIANNVLLGVVVLVRTLFMFHPRGDSESVAESLIQNSAGNDGRRATVKLKNLVRLVAIVARQVLGPLSADAWIGQQINTFGTGT